MWSVIEVMIKIIPLIAATLAIFRFLITTTNKSTIEILLTPNNKKYWEDFYELVAVSLIVTAGISIPAFIEFPFYNLVNGILIILDVIMLSVTGIIVLVLWVMSWFGDISNRKKIIEFSILGNFISVLLFIALVFSTLDTEIKKNIINNEITVLLIIYLVCVVFVFFLFQIYRSIFKALNKPKKNMYKIEPIESSKINEELKYLIFEFMIDDERHVMSQLSSRNSLDFPIFIYYPKEEKLIKYIRINDSSKKE